MALTSGTRLGPYEILSPIGAGGMGEVYKAKDTRLDRTVAIKVLPEHLTEHPELRQRFELEAKAVSSLNHPHICTLHDVGHESGVDFITMEYIEGETLASRLSRGALRFDEALRCAVQIASALDKAHRHGIVHRDLKPGNVMLTESGVKLLDFGLAKLTQGGAESDSAISLAPTQERPLTEKGAVLGTFQYMAPEQLESREVDARTDIFAFGALLYEMLTGKKAFTGKSQASLIAAILEHEPPPIAELQPMTPRLLDRIVRRCLAKDPNDRWQSARDVELELACVGDELRASAVEISPRHRWFWAVGGALVGALLAGGITWSTRSASPDRSPVSRFSITPPAGLRLDSRLDSSFALSPDGRTVVYAAVGENGRRLYRRSLDDVRSVAISGTEGGAAPFFSPDGRWIGFWTAGEIRKIPLAGGTPVTITQSSSAFLGGVWTTRDDIIFGTLSSPLQRVFAGGGAPEPITKLMGDELMHVQPALVGDESAIVFEARHLVDSFVAVQRFGEPDHEILLDGSSPSLAPTGHLIFARERTLWAAPFDVERLAVVGDDVALGDGAPFALTADGSLVYGVAGSPETGSALVWVDRGGERTVFAEDDQFRYPRVSPDGHWVVVNIGSDRGDLWIYDVERGRRTRLTTAGYSNHPVWSPDGGRVVFAGVRDSPSYDLYEQSVSGGEESALYVQDDTDAPTAWSPDGEFLSFLRQAPDRAHDIWLLPSNGEPEPLLATPFAEQALRFSPGGDWIAYVSNESGRAEVYVQSFPDLGRKYPISPNGGTEPVWARDGSELFYREGDRMMAVPIRTEPAFFAGDPVTVFEGNYAPAGFSGNANYDVAVDGSRFLMVEAIDGSAIERSELFVATHWLDELERLMATDRRP